MRKKFKKKECDCISLYNNYGIYGIRNKINNKIYVGKTEMNFGDRKDCHFASLRGGYHINPHLQKSFNKYGEDNFEFIVLYECKNNEDSDIVNGLEKKYIKLYKDKELAYNIGDGGDGGHNLGKHLSEETKRKIGDKNRINMTGRKATIETKKKMSESQKTVLIECLMKNSRNMGDKFLNMHQDINGRKNQKKISQKFNNLNLTVQNMI